MDNSEFVASTRLYWLNRVFSGPPPDEAIEIGKQMTDSDFHEWAKHALLFANPSTVMASLRKRVSPLARQSEAAMPPISRTMAGQDFGKAT